MICNVLASDSYFFVLYSYNFECNLIIFRYQFSLTFLFLWPTCGLMSVFTCALRFDRGQTIVYTWSLRNLVINKQHPDFRSLVQVCLHNLVTVCVHRQCSEILIRCLHVTLSWFTDGSASDSISNPDFCSCLHSQNILRILPKPVHNQDINVHVLNALTVCVQLFAS